MLSVAERYELQARLERRGYQVGDPTACSARAPASPSAASRWRPGRYPTASLRAPCSSGCGSSLAAKGGNTMRIVTWVFASIAVAAATMAFGAKVRATPVSDATRDGAVAQATTSGAELPAIGQSARRARMRPAGTSLTAAEFAAACLAATAPSPVHKATGTPVPLRATASRLAAAISLTASRTCRASARRASPRGLCEASALPPG